MNVYVKELMETNRTYEKEDHKYDTSALCNDQFRCRTREFGLNWSLLVPSQLQHYLS